LNDQEKADLTAARSEVGLYCISCQNCIPGCRLKLPVPDMMRAYMYAYGYSNHSLAKNLLRELNTNDNPCDNCSDCSVKCTRNFKVREKITDISRLVNVPDDFLA
jgi:predicted aldo/keto reductase-like oxidoreductase